MFDAHDHPSGKERASPLQEQMLDLLYATPFNQRLWHQFLELLARASNSDSAQVMVTNSFVTRTHSSTGGDQFTIAPSSMIEPGSEPRSHTLHVEVRFPEGMVSLRLRVRRQDSQPPYTATERWKLDRMQSHLQRLTYLDHHMESLERDTLVIKTSRQSQVPPYAFLDPKGRVRYLSPGACRLLDHETSLYLGHGQLCLRDPELQTRFTALIQSESQQGVPAVEPPVLGITRRSRCPMELQVVPLPPDILAAPCLLQSRILVYFRDPDQLFQDRCRQLTSHRGLTYREAQVACRIAEGWTPRQIAHHHLTSIHTVRTQLRSIFHKTDTRRQGDVTALVQNLALQPTNA